VPSLGGPEWRFPRLLIFSLSWAFLMAVGSGGLRFFPFTCVLWLTVLSESFSAHQTKFKKNKMKNLQAGRGAPSAAPGAE
jgi:hypothetical protein